MKTFIDSIIKILIFIVIFLTFLFIFSVFYAYLFAADDNRSLTSAISYVQSIGNEIISYSFADKNSVNLTLDNSTQTPTKAPTASNNFKYYYNQLDDNAKIIYHALENNIDNLKKENYTIDFATQFNDFLHQSNGQRQLNKSFQSALDAFFYDYPELFYIDITKISLTIKYSSIGPITKYTVKLSPETSTNFLHDSFSSETEVNTAISKVENIRNNLLNAISKDDDYTKILKIHDTLINSLEYDSNLVETHSHNIYGALVRKKVVCEGYAKAFKYILDALEIDNILVSGNATNSSGKTESHMWNYVKLSNNWYAIDVTWDDPIIIGGFSKDNIRHEYFLKGSRTFIESHVPSGKISDTGMLFSLPTLSRTNYK